MLGCWCGCCILCGWGFLFGLFVLGDDGGGCGVVGCGVLDLDMLFGMYFG